MRFTALKDFHSDDNGCDYVRDLSYTVRPKNKQLKDLVAQWVKEGKVCEGGAIAQMAGTGDVVPADDPKYQHFFNTPSGNSKGE